MMFGNQNQNSIFSLPTLAGQEPQALPSLPSIDAVDPSQPAPESFVWGQGGAQLSPEMLAARQKEALQRTRGDYSPISSVWQGLARVADNAVGGLELRDLDKQSSKMQAQQQQSIAALLSNGGTPGSGAPSPVAAALASPNPVLQKLGMAQYERDNPKPTVNDTERDYAFWQGQLSPQEFEQWKANKINPPHFAMLPNGQMGMVGGYQPQGSGAPMTKTVGDKTYYQVNGDWYDNPEGR